MANPETVNLREQLKALAQRLDAAPFGERRRIVEAQAEFLRLTPATLYRRLKQEVAWDSGRKTRADKGSTKQDERTLETIAAMQKQAVRKNGKATMHVPTAASIALVNGGQIAVGPQRLCRLLKDRRLDVETQKRDKAPISMRSLHPNHVHQADPSLCLMYHMGGKQHIIRDDEFYKNKLGPLAKIEKKLWRYVLCDHASGYIVPWYAEAHGENQDNLFQFLMHAWARRDGCDFHGVPRILIWDKGSANGAHAIRNMLDRLGVTAIAHEAGNPRAKGSVEGANNIVETHFECRLRFSPVSSVEELNAAASDWARAYNADLIPGTDSRLHRDGIAPVARSALWLTIRPEQLRLLPSEEICRALMQGKSSRRKVRGLAITYRHPQAGASLTYDVRGLDGICDGDEIEVIPLVYGECAVRVRIARYDGAPVEYELTPVAHDERYGFRLDAPVWGEQYRQQPDTAADRAAKKLDSLAFPELDQKGIKRAKQKNATPFGGGIDAIAHLHDIRAPIGLVGRGSEISVPDQAHVEIKPLSHVAACRALVRLLGRALLPGENAQVRAAFPEGVPEEEINALAARLRGDDGTALRVKGAAWK